MKFSAALLPGVALSLAAALISYALGSVIPDFSPMLAAIVMGALLTNLMTLSQRFGRGIDFSAKILLRVGIILLGLKLSLSDIFSLGWQVLLVVAAVVSVGIVSTMLLGRVMGISKHLSTLIACGFSICGAAAVAGVAGTIDPDDEHEEETVTAVALVVIYGTAMIALIPLLSHLFDLSPRVAALWAGASTHEIAQVVAIGGIMGGSALSIAVVVKLARVLLLAPVIAIVSAVRRRQTPSASAKLPPVIPPFVLGFLAMVLLRSFVTLPHGVLHLADAAQTILLAAAMFALGCGVRIRNLMHVGYKPFALAGLSTLIVASVGLVGVVLAG